jgi:predicted ArsR family transcriptional regulator
MRRIEEEAERYEVLEDEQRRRVYLIVRRATRAMSREEVAEAAGISKGLAAFHLDRLLEAGFLHAHYARPPGAGGPGAGRPAKRYASSDVEVAVLIPHRNYDLAGRVLARAIEDAGPAEAVRDRVVELAAAEGRAIGAALRKERHHRRLSRAASLAAAADLAEELGYEPVTEAGQVVLRNCPFHVLAATAPDLVCGLNRAFLAGALAGLGAGSVTADLVPEDGRCCVLLRQP